MSTPPAEPLQVTVTSSTTNEEALDILWQRVGERRRKYVHKASKLKREIEKEKVNLKGLIAEYDAESGATRSGLGKRIVDTHRLLDSVVRNFNAACEEDAGIQHLTNVATSQHRVKEVERRLLAVEVAPKAGIERETTGDESEVTQTGGAVEAQDNVPGDRLFRLFNDTMERIELDQIRDTRFIPLGDPSEA